MIWGFAGISGSFLVAVFSVNQSHAAVPVYRLAFSQRTPRNARPHEVGGGRTVRLHWFHSGIHVLHGRACFPPAITPAAGRPARCTVTVPGDTGSVGMWRLINNKLHRGSGGWPHPLPAFYRPRSRSDAPVTSRYTRSVAVHPIRRGAMPTDRVHRLTQQAQLRTLPPNTPQPAASGAATQPQNAHPGAQREALHPLRSATPDQKRCNAYGPGAPLPTTSIGVEICLDSPAKHEATQLSGD